MRTVRTVSVLALSVAILASTPAVNAQDAAGKRLFFEGDSWTTVTGNRVAAGSGGRDESSKVIVEGKADSSGRVEFRFTTPDDLGGLHGLWVVLPSR